MSVIESLHQAHKARLKRLSARSAPQRETPAPSRVAAILDLKAKRIPSRYLLDRDYERAWATVIMGLDNELPPRRPRIVEIQRATARHFDITVNEMLDDQRIRKLAMPRHAAMYLVKQLTLKSFAEVGRAFAGRDHSTVVHAVNGIKARLQFDGELAHHIACIRDELKKTFVLSEGRKQD
jgi:Bacterial dnaA protein helix-turn-helix